jgi:hypothetical protein
VTRRWVTAKKLDISILFKQATCIFLSMIEECRGEKSARLRQRALGEIFEKLLTIRVFYYRKLGGNFSIIPLRWGKFSIFTADSAPLEECLMLLFIREMLINIMPSLAS